MLSEENKPSEIDKNNKFNSNFDNNAAERKKWGSSGITHGSVKPLTIDEHFVTNTSIIKENDESIVNCIDSLDKEDINWLRESLRASFDENPIVKKSMKYEKPIEIFQISKNVKKNLKTEKINKPDKNDKIEENIEEILEEDLEIKEEMVPEEDMVEKDDIPEDIAPMKTIKFENPNEKFDVQYMKFDDCYKKKGIKVINARPISANIKSVEERRVLNKVGTEGEFKGVEEINERRSINTNPFKNRPKTEISMRKKVEIEVQTNKNNENLEKIEKLQDSERKLTKNKEINRINFEASLKVKIIGFI